MEFKGADVRFEYDSTKLKPSSLSTNDYAYNNDIFQFLGEFPKYMSHQVINDGEGVVRMNMALEADELIGGFSATYVVKNSDNTYSVDATNKDILVGRMSFRLFNGKIDDTTFKLKAGSQSPQTGIKINYNGKDSYEKADEPAVFRFTIASSNAYLKKIEYSICKDLSEELEYKEIEDFKKETLEYEITLNEYKEYISLIPTLDDEKSTIKVKIPKRDEDNELVYEDEKLVYEEKDLDENGKINLQLNELGKEDTIIEFIVLAEDGETTNTYKVKIHRPYGTIKGNIIYDTIEENENPDIIKITDLNFYKTGKFNWEELQDIFGEIYEEPVTYDDLDLIEKDCYYKSNEDGTYEVYIIPGTFDLQIDKRGFLDYIITDIVIKEGDTIDLEDITLTAGDVNRDRSYWTGRYTDTCK